MLIQNGRRGYRRPSPGFWFCGAITISPSSPVGLNATAGTCPGAEVHVVDAGHFALDTKAEEIAELVRAFMNKR
jgi:pimeloyl-ACP methyl ester carboxylesterase